VKGTNCEAPHSATFSILPSLRPSLRSKYSPQHPVLKLSQFQLSLKHNNWFSKPVRDEKRKSKETEGREMKRKENKNREVNKGRNEIRGQRQASKQAVCSAVRPAYLLGAAAAACCCCCCCSLKECRRLSRWWRRLNPLPSLWYAA
jgi:hypothetical protein